MKEFVARARAEWAATRNGTAGTVFWLRILWDLLGNAAGSQMDAFRRRRQQHEQLRRWIPVAGEKRRPDPLARLSELHREFGYVLRSLIRTPGYTVMTLATLGLGIGACTWIFSVIQPVLLAPLDYPEPDQLVVLYERSPGAERARSWVSPLTLQDWIERSESFEDMVSYRWNLYTWTGGERPRLLRGWAVSSGYFSLLGVELSLGREFSKEEDRPGAEPVVVINHAFWAQQFESDPGILGRTMSLDGIPYVIIGVAGSGVEFPPGGDYWIPAVIDSSRELRDFRYLGVIARLKDGVTREAAAAEMDRIAAGVAAEHPDTNDGWGVIVRGLKEDRLAHVRPILVWIGVAVGLLLLIAIGNVTNLSLARSTARRTEAAVRTALGAGRGVLARLQLIETLLLSLVGAALGFLLAIWGIGLLDRLAPGTLPRADRIAIDASSILFTVSAALAVGTVVGLLSLMTTRGGILSETLRAGGRGGTASRGSHRLRESVLTVQVALALALLIGAGLLTRSLRSLGRIEVGFSPENILTFSYSLPDAPYQSPDDRRAFHRELLTRLENIPGVEATGVVTPLPMEMGSVPSSWTLAPGPDDVTSPTVMAHMRVVTSGYFPAMRIPLVRGRLFTMDDRKDMEPVMLVNQSFVARYLAGRDPVGLRITYGEADAPDSEWSTIIGVVGDVRFRSLRSESEPELYLPLDQFPSAWGHLVVRSDRPRPDLTSAVLKAVGEVDPNLPLDEIKTGEDIISGQLQATRISTVLASLFAAVATVLATMGIIGVLSIVVLQRMPEIGIRIALGATPGGVSWLLLVRGMKPVLFGLVLGIGLALPGTHLLAGQVYGVSTLDPVSFSLATFILVVVGALACLIPGRRAAQADPVRLLRTE
jgi:putative ABC transport system permease protein